MICTPLIFDNLIGTKFQEKRHFFQSKARYD